MVRWAERFALMAARGIQDGKTYDSGKLGKSFNRRFLQQIAYNHRSYCLSRSSTKPSLIKAVINRLGCCERTGTAEECAAGGMLTTEQGAESGRRVALATLASLKANLGSLDRCAPTKSNTVLTPC